jgi:hypothetical protein
MKPRIGIALYAALAVLALALVPAALASKGGGGKGGTNTSTDPAVSLVVLDSNDGLPHWGDNVTFTVTTSESEPYVTLTCSQNGVPVLTQTSGFWAGYGPGQVYGLMNGTWTSGAADCSATLYATTSNGKAATLATTSFHVYA